MPTTAIRIGRPTLGPSGSWRTRTQVRSATWIGAEAVSWRTPEAPITGSAVLLSWTVDVRDSRGVAAAARALTLNAPAANPSSAARRCATVAVGAPSR